jgi:putative ABC transport system permease protein
VKNNGPEQQPDPEFYIPWKEEENQYFRTASVILRTPLDSETMAKWLRTETAALDPALPVSLETMTQRVHKLTQRQRFDAVLLSFFALLGVALGGIGIYGVVGFLVAQRTQEIGVRMALGANPGSILKMILGNVARWTLAGAVAGMTASWFASRMLRSLLFRVPARDPAVFCVALGILVTVAFVSAWIPARRAMRVDPMIALRYE